MCLSKCLIYGVIIAILIIILIKVVYSFSEGFDGEVVEDNDDKLPQPVEEEIDNVDEEEEIIEDKEDKEDKGLLTTIVDKVKSILPDDDKEIKASNEDELNKLTTTDEEGKPEDITILPKFIDNLSSSVFDGVKMMPENAYSPWSNVYMDADNDTSYMIDLGDGKDNKDGGSGRFSERSPACCSAQYPLPFELKVDDKIAKNKDKYVAGPYMGNNNWKNSGCQCLTRENAIKLAKRGGNA